MKTTNVTTMKWILLGLAAATFGGCDMMSEHARHDEFLPTNDACPVRQYANMQSTASARGDATLSAYHFDGAKLNELGRARLDMMTSDRAGAMSSGGATT